MGKAIAVLLKEPRYWLCRRTRRAIPKEPLYQLKNRAAPNSYRLRYPAQLGRVVDGSARGSREEPAAGCCPAAGGKCVEERLGQNRGASTQGFAFLILIGFDNMKRLSIWWPTLKTMRAGLVPLRSR
jgi:hypothetical protein